GQHSGPEASSGWSRRQFIGLAAAGAVGLPLVLAACGSAAAPASSPASNPSTAPAGSAPASVPVASGAGAGSNVFPTFIPATNKPKPDYPAANPQLSDGYDKYPANPAKALPAQPPGTG